MGRKLKSGTRGIVSKYITRNTALRKLQLSLADFRRLCIFKGVYPRDPKKKPKGQDKTYYHVKDILYLSHEPLIQHIRKNHILDRKYRRFITRREYACARAVNKPKTFTLYHILQERYKTFIESLYDLDDAISTLALVTCIKPRVDSLSIDLISSCEKVLYEFYLYIINNRLIRKVFCSVKGYYIQIKFFNENITFLIPHELPQEIPQEVDFKVVATFTELYHALVTAINFKAYQLVDAVYPPKLDTKKLLAGLRFLALKYEFNKDTNNEEFTSVNDQLITLLKESESSISDSDLKLLTKASEDDKKVQNLFSDCTVYISREVPLFVTAMLLISCGAKNVFWQAIGYSEPEDSKNITHQIIDRNLTDHHKNLPDRDFIQPQWIFDSINAGKLLPTYPYRPGAKLPFHYSPFVTKTPDVNDIYKSLQLNEIAPNTSNLESDSEEDTKSQSQIVQTESNTLNDDKKKQRKLLKKQQEEIERRKVLLSKKHKRLLQRIEYTANEQLKKKEKLLKKKQISKTAQV